MKTSVKKQSVPNDQQLLRLQACPMTASVKWDSQDDTQEDRVKWYTYYNKLPTDIRLGLADEQILEQVLVIAEKYEILDEARVGEISRMAREFFFKPRSQKELQKRIKENLEIKNKEDLFCEDFLGLVEMIKKRGKEELDLIVEKIPIIPALKKYPELKDQIISKNNLKVFEVDKFIQPTVGSWIDDYIQRKGAQAHDNLQRSDYLFNLENGQKLSVEEREKIETILISYDKDTPINIHIENQEIIFIEGFRPQEVVLKKSDKAEHKKDSETGTGKKKSFFGFFGGKKKKQEVDTKRNSLADFKIENPFSDKKVVASDKNSTQQEKSTGNDQQKTPLEKWKTGNLQQEKTESIQSDMPRQQKKDKNKSIRGEQFRQKSDTDQKNILTEKKNKKEEMPVKGQEIGWFGSKTAQKTLTRNYKEKQNIKQGHIVDLKENTEISKNDF